MSRVPPTLSRPTERAHRVLVFTTPSCPWCIGFDKPQIDRLLGLAA